MIPIDNNATRTKGRKRTFDVNTGQNIFKPSPVIPRITEWEKQAMRYASPILANISTFSRGIKWQIFISRIWSPLSKLFLSPLPWFPFLSIPFTTTWNAIEEILYRTRFVFKRFTYCIRVYIIYSVSWRFVSIIVTLRNMRRENLWIMCIFVIFVGNKFGFERSVIEISLSVKYVYINI